MKNCDSFHSEIVEAYIIADQGSVIEVSEEFIFFTGYTEGELLNKNIESLFLTLRIGPNFKAANISEHIEYFLFTKSLEVRFVYFKEIKESNYIVKYVIKEKSGSRLEDKFSYVCQLLCEDIVGISIYSAPDLTLLKANKTYLDFNDAPFNTWENAFGRLKCDLIPGYAGSNYEAINNDLIEKGTSHYLKEFAYHGFKRGTTYWDEIVTPVKENGKVRYIITNTKEVTDLVHSNILLDEAQKQLLKAEHEKNQALEQAMAMKDEFLSLISHELRTPITVIDSATQAIQYICWDELPEKAQRYIKIIKQNTYRQLRLVNNLLDIMRVNAGRIKINARNIDIVFLSKNIVDSVFPYADKGGIKFEFISEFDKKVIGIDDEKYERILLNLLSNAIKYTPEGESISVCISSIDNKICIKVKDTGIGIPEDKLDLIFERFGQVDSLLSRRAEGAGIGLSLAKKFTEAIGGSISVKSDNGKGSTFTLLLPDKAAAEEVSEAQDINISENRHVEISRIEFSDIYF